MAFPAPPFAKKRYTIADRAFPKAVYEIILD